MICTHRIVRIAATLALLQGCVAVPASAAIANSMAAVAPVDGSAEP